MPTTKARLAERAPVAPTRQALPAIADRPPEPMATDVLRGLQAPRKRLPSKYFYDERGSHLFEEITALPEYYPTRAELEILDTQKAAIAGVLAPDAVLVEFGSGSTAKVRRVLAAVPNLACYVPIDISGEFIEGEARALRADFPQLRVLPVVADFTRPFTLPAEIEGRMRVGFFPGSTIGNFEPLEALAFLGHARRMLGAGSRFIAGVDLVKEIRVLEAAYDDTAGVTAAFNMNLLTRINRELGADFDLAKFRHLACFDPVRSRIEMHLRSLERQVVHVLGEDIAFAEGETIHTENSYKYTLERFRRLATEAGWLPTDAWTDAAGRFSVHVLDAGA